MKAALLSNVTVEVLADMLRKEHAVWTPSGFGAWMQTALEPPAELKAFDPEAIYLILDGRFAAFDPAEAAAARTALAAAFPKAAVVVPDLERLAADYGADFYDERMWRLAQMPFTLKGLRTLKALFGFKKVLAIDLDGTLWTGVVGEDGVDGIVPKAEFQKAACELKRRGVLLAALSKNNPEDVQTAWTRPDMLLKAEDFVSLKVNWADKPANLLRLAEELNLGPDAFVFVDDNPAERAQMRAQCPMVTVADFPPQWEVYFPLRTVTAEDAARTAQYQAEAARRAFGSGLSVDDYLSALDLQAEIHALRADEVPRVAQLSQKSNQFNVTTRRYAEAEVARMQAEEPRRLFLTVRAGDRFGDQGLVAFAHATIAGNCAELVDFVLSCRVMNRTLEFAVEAFLEGELLRRGVRELKAEYVPTAKNAPVRDLFARFGFEPMAANRYRKALPGKAELKHFYKVKGV